MLKAYLAQRRLKKATQELCAAYGHYNCICGAKL